MPRAGLNFLDQAGTLIYLDSHDGTKDSEKIQFDDVAFMARDFWPVLRRGNFIFFIGLFSPSDYNGGVGIGIILFVFSAGLFWWGLRPSFRKRRPLGMTAITGIACHKCGPFPIDQIIVKSSSPTTMLIVRLIGGGLVIAAGVLLVCYWKEDQENNKIYRSITAPLALVGLRMCLSPNISKQCCPNCGDTKLVISQPAGQENRAAK